MQRKFWVHKNQNVRGNFLNVIFVPKKHIDAEVIMKNDKPRSFEQIYWLEDVLNISGICKKSMITKYLSNVDLYFLQQVSKSISNALHDEFMKKLKKNKY